MLTQKIIGCSVQALVVVTVQELQAFPTRLLPCGTMEFRMMYTWFVPLSTVAPGHNFASPKITPYALTDFGEVHLHPHTLGVLAVL